MTRFGTSDNSPSRTAGHCRSKTIIWQRSTSHACTCGTLRQYVASRNKKLTSPCAKTVEDRTSLWKASENFKKSESQINSLLVRRIHRTQSKFRNAVSDSPDP